MQVETIIAFADNWLALSALSLAFAISGWIMLRGVGSVITAFGKKRPNVTGPFIRRSADSEAAIRLLGRAGREALEKHKAEGPPPGEGGG